MLNTAPHIRGFQKGDRNPTSVVAGEGSQGEGESKHPLPVRLFGDFLFAQKVTPRSDRQLVAAKKPIKNAAFFKKEPPGFFIPGGFALIQNQ